MNFESLRIKMRFSSTIGTMSEAMKWPPGPEIGRELYGQPQLLNRGLKQLEPDAGTGKSVKRVVAVGTFGIQYSNGVGNFISNRMMVADDQIDPLFFGDTGLLRWR
jgi:hypothetical protein